MSQARHALHHAHAGAFDGIDLFRVVREQADFAQAEVAQNRSRQRIAAQVGFEAQLLIGLDRIRALVLQLVSAQLVEQADAAAFLRLVDQQPAALARDAFDGNLQLRPAIAAQAVENVAGQALGMNANQRCAAGQVAHFQGDSYFVPGIRRTGVAAAKAVDAERAKFGGKVRFGHFFERRRGSTVHDTYWGTLTASIIMAFSAECCKATWLRCWSSWPPWLPSRAFWRAPTALKPC